MEGIYEIARSNPRKVSGRHVNIGSVGRPMRAHTLCCIFDRLAVNSVRCISRLMPAFAIAVVSPMTKAKKTAPIMVTTAANICSVVESGWSHGTLIRVVMAQ